MFTKIVEDLSAECTSLLLSYTWYFNGKSVNYLSTCFSVYQIGVHIADVSYFVDQDSLVDLEARARGTTVYMVGKSWHMLPGVLRLVFKLF